MSYEFLFIAIKTIQSTHKDSNCFDILNLTEFLIDFDDKTYTNESDFIEINHHSWKLICLVPNAQKILFVKVNINLFKKSTFACKFTLYSWYSVTILFTVVWVLCLYHFFLYSTYLVVSKPRLLKCSSLCSHAVYGMKNYNISVMKTQAQPKGYFFHTLYLWWAST